MLGEYDFSPLDYYNTEPLRVVEALVTVVIRNNELRLSIYATQKLYYITKNRTCQYLYSSILSKTLLRYFCTNAFSPGYPLSEST